jgi:hypothetical protein
MKNCWFLFLNFRNREFQSFFEKESESKNRKSPITSKTLKNQQWTGGFNAQSFNIFDKKLGTRVTYQKPGLWFCENHGHES